MQYDINREPAKISAFSTGKIQRYLTSKEPLPSDQIQIKEQAKFTYSSVGKALEKQAKATEVRVIKANSGDK